MEMGMKLTGDVGAAGDGAATGKRSDGARLRTAPSREALRKRRQDCGKRLEDLPGLRIRLEKGRRRLDELENGGLPMRQMAVARFQRSGVRLSEEQIFQALLKDIKARIAADLYEIQTLEEALGGIEGDHYYPCVYDRFVLGMDDEDIAAALGCDESTVRKHRVRLMNTLGVVLC